MKKYINPLSIIFVSILVVFIISRLIAWLIIDKEMLSRSLFLTIDGFRLRHFVYGNVLLLITSFIAIGLRAKINKNWLALFYGIGLGLVLDEFPLWMGDVKQLNSYTVFIPYAPIVILASLILIILFMLARAKKISS